MSTSHRVTFCGLGQMGSAMAGRMLEAGHTLTVWNRTQARTDPLVARGAKRARTPADAAHGTEVAITMLADPDALEAVVLGDGGLAGGMAPGTTLIEMSTVGRDAVERVAAVLDQRGIHVIDAPVLGSLPQAREGTLKVFAGGPADQVERWRPLLECVGTVTHFGPLGSGAAMKLVANSTLVSLMSALGEALALAGSLGLDRHQVFDVLVDSPIRVTAASKRALVERGSYPPNFKLALAVKDAALVSAAATAAGLDLRLVEAARSWFEDALAAGLGEMDYSAVVARITGSPASLP
ncbi:MAG TPA: NAD(P)-dependent oxidoreductase [Actinomycetota bacterium]|nr:NAD(P)-dependent oxidoreductase [Actinomycetota bacterium]